MWQVCVPGAILSLLGLFGLAASCSTASGAAFTYGFLLFFFVLAQIAAVCAFFFFRSQLTPSSPCPRVHSSFDLHSTCWVTKLICQKATHSPTMKYVGSLQENSVGRGFIHKSKLFSRGVHVYWVGISHGIPNISLKAYFFGKRQRLHKA